VKRRVLPESDRGRHAKTWLLLNDPEIKEELSAYLRTNKWSMNPEKLVEYSKSKLVTDEMKKFVQNAVNKEMPQGLKKYLEQELFPRIGYKVVRGISLSPARQWLHEQGFEYTEVKKGLFYDGHERPDNVDYRQNVFIPAFDALRPYFVEYRADNLELMVPKPPLPPGEFWLVLTAHDEMTAQANNADKWVWCLKGEMPICKKGVGRGIHRSDIICSTVGHIMEAGEGLEYGKNHDGYWMARSSSNRYAPPLSPLQVSFLLSWRRKPSPPLNAAMIATYTGPVFSSIIPKAIALTPSMPLSSLG
jgi:hypothetical protein